jgi:hypothetical protein
METVRFWDPEGQLRLVLVVAAAAKRDVLDGGQSSPRIRPNVMEFQERAFGAPVSVWGDEAALASVTPPGRALDVPRDVARSDDGCPDLPIRPGADRTRCPRVCRRPHLRLLDLLEEQGEGAVEDRGRITVRDLAAQEGLNAPKLENNLAAANLNEPRDTTIRSVNR